MFGSRKNLFTAPDGIEEALEDLRAKGMIYEGVPEPPKGKLPDDWEPRKQTLFKSTEHGDDVDRPVMKSDGSWTYFAPDIAYHYDKVRRGYDALIDVFGADHGGYVKRMKAAVSALSEGRVPLDIKLIQLVRLFRNGEPLKMSKRAGTFVTLRDVVDQVGADATRFLMLTRRNDAPLDFDFGKALEQSKDNPVFYVQYAHARVRSVLRKAGASALATQDAPKLEDETEFAVARKLAEWPRLVESAARLHEPHRIAFYLYDLASEFHALWNKGSERPELRFLREGTSDPVGGKIAFPCSRRGCHFRGLGHPWRNSGRGNALGKDWDQRQAELALLRFRGRSQAKPCRPFCSIIRRRASRFALEPILIASCASDA